VNYSINGGPPVTGSTSEWNGGDRYGAPGDLYYHIVRGTVAGADAGDSVRVWFTGGGATSDSFTFDVVGSAPKDVLVVAAEDYSGPSNVPAYASTAGPHFLSYYTDALAANGVSFDVYDVDARGRTAPDHLGRPTRTCRSGRPTTRRRTGTSCSSRLTRSARTIGPRCPTPTATPAPTSATRPSATRARRAGTPTPTTRSIRSSPTTRPGTGPMPRAIPLGRPATGTRRPAVRMAGRSGTSTCPAMPGAKSSCPSPT
jgi:hypothetical protein